CEVVEEGQRVVAPVPANVDGLRLVQTPAPVDVEVDPLGRAALVRIDGAEAREAPRADGPDRDLARPVPAGPVVRGPGAEVHALGYRRLRLGEDVEAVVAVWVLEGTVAAVVLRRDQCLERVARRREQSQIAL